MRTAFPSTAAAAAAVAFAAACGGDTGTEVHGGGDSSGNRPPVVTLAALEIPAPPGALQPDASVRLQANGRYSDDSVRPLTDSATWSSTSPAVVSVSDSVGSKGRATAVGTGGATISASYGGKTGAVPLTALGVTALTVTPSAASVDVGRSVSLNAQATLSDGATIPAVARASWRSSDSSVVVVSDDSATRGRVTGMRGGAATITASWRGATGQATITSIGVASVAVLGPFGTTIGPFPIGGTIALTAMARLSNGSVQVMTDAATWSASTAAVTVSNAPGARGTATRTGEDSAFVSATIQGVTGTLLLRKSCVVLASGLSFDVTQGIGVAYLQVDGADVVWFDYDPLQPGTGGAFRTVPKIGGAVRTIASGIPYAGQWAMDAAYIYWMFVRGSGDQTYKVVRMSRATGVIDTLLRNGGIGGGPRGIAVDGSFIYYTPGEFGGVRRLPKAGGAVTSFFAGSSFSPLWLSLDAGTVYGVDTYESPARARRVPTGGGKMDTLASARSSRYSAVDGGYLYWTENFPPTSRLARVPLAGGTATTVATAPTMDGFAIADGYAYYGGTFAQPSPGSGVLRQAVAGGSPQVVTDECGYSPAESMSPKYLATDGTYIYFSELSGSSNRQARILRVTR